MICRFSVVGGMLLMLMLKYLVQRQQEMVWMKLTAAGRPPRREGDRPLPPSSGGLNFATFTGFGGQIAVTWAVFDIELDRNVNQTFVFI